MLERVSFFRLAEGSLAEVSWEISMMSRTPLNTVLGTMPWASLYSRWTLRRRAVSSMAARMEGVMESA